MIFAKQYFLCKADFIKKVSVHSFYGDYLSLSARVAKSTFFMKSPVAKEAVFKTLKNILSLLKIYF